jgi:hypothetical protein
MHSIKSYIFSFDATLERGIFFQPDNGGLSGGSVTALQGSYFLSDKFGLRSGVSCISKLGRIISSPFINRIPTNFDRHGLPV